jgi:hypothetical protein|tara:strand:+ start:2687 stop:2854 length:168 start_codon:yes stop_codon:yes gene_type:complete
MRPWDEDDVVVEGVLTEEMWQKFLKEIYLMDVTKYPPFWTIQTPYVEATSFENSR